MLEPTEKQKAWLRNLESMRYKQHTVTATPCNGVNLPMGQHACTMDIDDSLPPDIIGECVTEATKKAWAAGHDPAVDPFLIIVTFN